MAGTVQKTLATTKPQDRARVGVFGYFNVEDRGSYNRAYWQDPGRTRSAARRRRALAGRGRAVHAAALVTNVDFAFVVHGPFAPRSARSAVDARTDRGSSVDGQGRCSGSRDQHCSKGQDDDADSNSRGGTEHVTSSLQLTLHADEPEIFRQFSSDRNIEGFSFLLQARSDVCAPNNLFVQRDSRHHSTILAVPNRTHEVVLRCFMPRSGADLLLATGYLALVFGGPRFAQDLFQLLARSGLRAQPMSVIGP
jgi:hypothetical protein